MKVLQCPSGCVMDARGRRPVTLACPCQHVVCAKCAAALAGVPRGAGLAAAALPCALCGLDDGPAYNADDCKADLGMLLAVMDEAPTWEMYGEFYCVGRSLQVVCRNFVRVPHCHS